MRNRLLLALFATLAFSVPYAAAQTARYGPPKPPADDADLNKQFARMQENVKRMQGQMDRIHETKDPKERHELMDEHGKTMQENMQMLRGMGGPMMMDTMREHGTGGGIEGDAMAGMDPGQQLDFMRGRMDMMQMMMEQMMRHQQMMRAAPAQ